MQEKEIQQLIESKIAEAKLDIADKRFNHLSLLAGGILAIFGIAFPIWQSSVSTDKIDNAVEQMRYQTDKLEKINTEYSEKIDSKLRETENAVNIHLKDLEQQQQDFVNNSSGNVDQAIKSMNSQFKELAGTAIRKPDLVCLLNGQSLGSSNITIKPESNVIYLQLKNQGSAFAHNISGILYLKTNKEMNISTPFIESREFPDEPGYDQIYNLEFPNSLDAQRSYPIEITIYSDKYEKNTIQALLKIYYDQPEPLKYTFNILTDK